LHSGRPVIKECVDMSIIELKYIGALNHGSVMTRHLG
jgi:hypothetical protein